MRLEDWRVPDDHPGPTLPLLRSTLLRQLQRRFGEIPEDLVAIIEATKEQARLDGWLDQVVTVDRLEDVGIG